MTAVREPDREPDRVSTRAVTRPRRAAARPATTTGPATTTVDPADAVDPAASVWTGGSGHGPLAGVRVLELAALGPAPYGVMLLADLGADVVRVDRPPSPNDLSHLMAGCHRGRRSITLDLKRAADRDTALRLADTADVLVEGYRPGVAERLGIGPDVCAARNPRLVYARMTGWGQDGPLAPEAGHELNFLAIAGVLHGTGRPDSPPPPTAGYMGDFGGGGTFLALGVLAALLERQRSGRGQVVDASVLDGAASLAAYVHGLAAMGQWSDERGSNLSDGGRPFYDTYATSDGGHVAVGALEPKFYSALLRELGMAEADWPQSDASRWPALRVELTRRFAAGTRDEWAARFAGRDACVTPVLTLAEAPAHPHNAARGVYARVPDGWAPRPAPRFSRTDGVAGSPPPALGEHSDAIRAAVGADRVAAGHERDATSHHGD